MAKMSEKQEPAKPSLCDNFEPQAWRKTVCKNCFQAPEKHMTGGGAQNDSNKNNDKKQTHAAGNQGKTAGNQPMTSTPENTKTPQNSSASSIKNKYEQLEKDKHKPKEPPKVAPKTKGPGGLSLITNKYEHLENTKSSASAPSTPATPGTPENKMEKYNIPPPTFPKQARILDIKFSDKDSDEDVRSGKVVVNKLVKSKFGSVDNISDTEETSKLEVVQRSKFGSMENISFHAKKKDPIPIPVQKGNIGGSFENVSQSDKHTPDSGSQNKAMDFMNKLDNFSIEIRSGATSNAGSTVIHQQPGGKVDIITIPIKRPSAPSTPTTDNKQSWSNKESLQNELNEHKLSKGPGKVSYSVNHEIKSPSPEIDPRRKFSRPDLKSPTSEKTTKPELNISHSEQSKNLNLKSPSPEKKFSGLKSTTPDLKSPSSEIKASELKSPTSANEKLDSKVKLEKTELKNSKIDIKFQDLQNKNEKVDFRLALKKPEKTDTKPTENKTAVVEKVSNKLDLKSQLKSSNDKQMDSVNQKGASPDKTELASSSKNKFELPQLKSSKSNSIVEQNKNTPGAKDNKVEKYQRRGSGANNLSVAQTNDNSSSKQETSKDSCDQTTLESSRNKEIKEKDRSMTETNKISQDVDKSNTKILGIKEKDIGKENNELLNKFAKKDEKPLESKWKTKTQNDKSNEINYKLGNKEQKEDTSELLSKFAKKNVGKVEPKAKEENSEKKSELASKFAKRDDKKLEPKSEEVKVEEKAAPASKFDQIDANKPKEEKIEEKSNHSPNFANKDEKPMETKCKEGIPEIKSDITSKCAKKDDNTIETKSTEEKQDTKSELDSNSAKKDDTTVEAKSKEETPKKSDFASKFSKMEDKKVETSSKEVAERNHKKPESKSKDEKQEEKSELSSKFAKKDENRAEFKDKPKVGLGSKFDNKQESNNELLSKFSKRNEIKNEPKVAPKTAPGINENRKTDNKATLGKQDESKPELLSKFGNKDEKKKVDLKAQDKKPEEKRTDIKSKFGNQEENKSELLSRFAKKDDKKIEPKPKPEEKKSDIKSKFGNQEENKSELLSRFAKKDDKKIEPKPKPEEKKSDIKSKFGKKEEEKSELLSRFNKKDDPKSKSEKTDEKPLNKYKALHQTKDKIEEDKKPIIKRLGKQESGTSKLDDKKPPGARLNSEKPDNKDAKSPFERPGLKSIKSDEPKGKFSMPNLKSAKDNETKSNDTKTKESDKTVIESKKSTDSDSKDKKGPVETQTTDIDRPDTNSHAKKLSNNENSKSGSTPDKSVVKEATKTDPSASLISNLNHFDDISTEGEATLGDDLKACAPGNARDSSHVHVDTQVFTSSRQKTAGVIGQEEIESYAAASRLGLSDLDNDTRGNSVDSKSHQNGNISAQPKSDIETGKVSLVDTATDADLEKVRSELKLFMERCQNLENENEVLRQQMDKKENEFKDVKRDKNEIEASVKSLQSKVKTMEEKCSNLEADNVKLSGNIKTQQESEDIKSNNTDDHEEKITINEKIMESILDENDNLKQEVNDLKMEMDEMYDSFRDQEAEEFRELQRELEITAKNCRILQFKLRKMERMGGQIEQEKQQVEEKLRMLQNQFQDRDAVSHIHSLEDELRMAKDVSVRLHDELDLMEDKRGKMDEENRHLTELLEQADRKQFRLEMEVDKLRDKIIELKQEIRIKDDPNADRKATLAAIGRQESMDRELQQLKRELYDSKEREADLKDQLKFLEGENKSLSKKVSGLEEEGDHLSKQLKKMSIERAISGRVVDKDMTESQFELKIQFELAEKELATLRRKMLETEEENEMLHSEMFTLEQKLREKDRQLQTVPEPSSPKLYYEDKIKYYEKEADDFRTKLLQRENEIAQLFAQISATQSKTKHLKDLRKCKSLDYECDYNLVVDLRRQVALSQQECTILRERIDSLERELDSKLQELEMLQKNNSTREPPTFSGLAVAYVDTDNDVQLRKQLQQTQQTYFKLCECILQLSKKLTSLVCNNHPLNANSSKGISKIQNTSLSDIYNQTFIDNSCDTATGAGLHKESVVNPKVCSSELTESFSVFRLPVENSSYYISSAAATGESENYTNSESAPLSRDPYTLLCVIDETFCNVLKLACDMASVGEVPADSDSTIVWDSPETHDSSDMNVSQTDIVRTESESSLDNEKSVDTININSEVPIESGMADSVDSDKHTATKQGSVDVDESVENKVNSNDYKIQKDRILFLEEEIDDLRLIIKSKEDKNVALEEELQSLELSVKSVQADSRCREMELLNEMDLIHSKNEILTNLLEIVRERAEAAEAEQERLLTEQHEKRLSTDSSSEKTNPYSEVSDGSDDVFDGSQTERVPTIWEEQFKKRICSLETLLAEERNKITSLEKKLEITKTDVISSAMSDDAKLHQREKELLQSELQESERHAKIANDHIRSLTEKLKKVETAGRSSPIVPRQQVKISSSSDEYEDAKEKLEPYCKTCSELQSVKDQLCTELYIFKDKAEELEQRVEEGNAIWVSKNAATEKEKHIVEQRLKQKYEDCKKLEEQLNKLREEDRMKDIFMKERDTNLKDKTAQITRKDEIIQEQEDIIRQREEDMQQLFDQISQREKNLKEYAEQSIRKDDAIKERDAKIKQLQSFIDEKNEEVHLLEEEMQDCNLKRKESETLIAEMKEKLEDNVKGEKTEVESENERLQSDVDNLMTNITQLHDDKVTLQNELDKSKQALSEAMLMWDRDRSTLGSELAVTKEKMWTMEVTANKKEPQAVQALRKEVHSIIETKEKIALQALLSKIEHDNTVRVLKNDKFKLTEELTSKIRMLTHEMTNNDKMADELSQLRGQDEINYQLHHHEKLLRAEYMAMKVRYESQLGRLQKEHLQLLEVVERLQREKNLDSEIILGIQKGMSNIKETYTHDLTKWKDERTVLESHIKQIEEGKEIALHLRAQIDALKQQLSEQEMLRTELVNKMTSERQGWDIEKANLNSNINQLEEQLAMFVQVQSKNKDTQFRMEIAWGKEREEQKRLLAEAHCLAMDLQNQLQKRDEEHAREKKNLLEQIEKHRYQYNSERSTKDKITLEVTTGENKIKHLEQQLQETKDKHKKEEEIWMKDKGDMLRRLAEMRKAHMRDSRRIDDVLSALKRLRELAAIVNESETSATLPSNGSNGAEGTIDASAASASVTTDEGEMENLKQNIDQIVLKYVKESLQQIHHVTEELAKPAVEVTKEDRQKIRRSLSSSEIDLLKDEFLIGPQDPGRHRGNGISDPHTNRRTLQRTITHDGNGVTSDHLPSDYIENILMEQSTFYKDGKDTNVEVHKIKSRTETTRVETTVTSLPKPPPSFVIPRSRSTSPCPQTGAKLKRSNPTIHSLSEDIGHSHRLSAPIGGVVSRSSSADSSPVGMSPIFIPISTNGLPRAGSLQSGSLDRLSPSTARKKFFEEQPGTSYLSWPARHKNKTVDENRNSKSLSNSSEFAVTMRENSRGGNGQIRTSVSMDESAMSPIIKKQESSEVGTGAKSKSMEHVKHAGLRDMFKTMKKKLRPKVKRSQSAREFERPSLSKDKPKIQENLQEGTKNLDKQTEERHTVHEHMTPIDIPPDVSVDKEQKSKKDGNTKKDRSRSSKSKGEKDDAPPESAIQKLKKRFRSKSADRAHDRHVTSILVGHSEGSQNSDGSWQYSETCV